MVVAGMIEGDISHIKNTVLKGNVTNERYKNRKKRIRI